VFETFRIFLMPGADTTPAVSSTPHVPAPYETVPKVE
jgi:hypothetical protein